MECYRYWSVTTLKDNSHDGICESSNGSILNGGLINKKGG